MDERQRLLVLVWRANLYVHKFLLARGDPGSRIGADYGIIRSQYIDDLAGAMLDYAESEGSVTRPRNVARRAILTAFDLAYYTGYIDNGGNVSEMSADDTQWIIERTAAEVGYIDGVFLNLREMRVAGDEDLEEFIWQRAANYANTLDGIYAEGKARALRDIYVTFRLGETEEHCEPSPGKYGCAALNGKRHKLRWFIDRGIIPQSPGSNTTCGGWRCACTLIDSDGNQVIP